MSLFSRIAGTLAGAALACSAYAGQITFGGFVTDVSGTYAGGLLPGVTPNGQSTRFTGGLSWTSGAAVAGGIAENTVTGMWFDFGNGLLFSLGGTQTYNNVQIRNDGTDFGEPAFDGFYAYSQWLDAQGRFEYTELGLSLQSLALLAIAAADTLPGSLDLSHFIDPNDLVGLDNVQAGESPYGFCANGCVVDKQSAGIEFHATNAQDERSVHLYGVIDQVGTVPEPATWALLAGGLLALHRTRRIRG